MEKEAIYKSRIDNFKQKQNQLKSKLLRLSLLRLAIFLGCTAGIYFFWSTTLAVVGFILGFIISFIVLVKIHAAQKRALQKTKLLININQKEIKALHGDISSFDDGKIYKDASHAFADDIDLFGEQSLFQFIN